ncbi:hypothetical protein QEN19_001269 [Hanseniaspora menglaensis]
MEHLINPNKVGDFKLSITIAENYVDISETTNYNTYNNDTAEGNLYATLKNDQQDENTLINFKFYNLSNNTTLEEMRTKIKEEELSFNISDWVFAYRINLSNCNKNKPLYKVFGDSSYVIQDLLLQNDKEKSNIYLLPANYNETFIKQKNGILLKPESRWVVDSPRVVELSQAPEIPSKTDTTPTINTINKLIAPNITVLVVEDNPINCEINLIFMDLQLPIISGIEASQTIRKLEAIKKKKFYAEALNEEEKKLLEEYPLYKNSDESFGDEFENSKKLSVSLGNSFIPCIIVALTASNSLQDKNLAIKSGCNDYLTKPVNLVWLSSKLMEWGYMQSLMTS